MSISPPSAHSQHWVRRTYLIAAALLTAAPACVVASGQSAAGSAVHSKLSELVSAQVSSSAHFPSDRKSSVTWLNGPSRVGTGQSHRVIGVVKLTFAGLTNSYCRLVSAGANDPSAPIMIPVPETANHDTCQGVQSVQSADLDGDGLLDFAYAARIPSNRYELNVLEVVVFLGQSNKAQPYCYSSAASRAFAPEQLGRTSKAIAGMKQALRRLDIKTFSCDTL